MMDEKCNKQSDDKIRLDCTNLKKICESCRELDCPIVQHIPYFHAGCYGCTRREQDGGIYNCTNCCYFDAHWTAPDLNNSKHHDSIDD